jgi:uncharacterized repeat protein (TIGR03803 family)
MSRRRHWRNASAIFLFCAATAIAAPAQTYTDLFNFDGSDGSGPFYMSLVQGTDGNLYGTTAYGSGGNGNVFKMTPAGVLTSLFGFDEFDGDPYTGLVLGTDTSLYGTTAEGGGTGAPGTVFKADPGFGPATLYAFCSQFGCSDGEWPYAPLFLAADGNFYGTTYYGGSQSVDNCWNGRVQGCGTVFRITLEGRLTTLYRFCKKPNCADGSYPTGGLVEDTHGSFYGTTNGNFYAPGKGGATIFKITSAGKFTTLYTFCSQSNCSDGNYPYPGLIGAADGNFYGTTAYGGTNCPSLGGCGTVFRITPAGELRTIHSFDGIDGSRPYAGLIQATDGDLYGTTANSGSSQCVGCGTVFRITPDGALTTLHTFDGTDGYLAYGGLFQSTDGKFYGTTYAGGTYGYGNVYSLDMGLGPFVTFVQAAGKVGQTGGILGQGFTGTTNVSLNGISASFTVVSDTFIRATVPLGATTGYVSVTTPSGTLTSNVPFHVIR